MTEDLRTPSFTTVPSPNYQTKILCPECGHILPVTSVTECDRCGAHLELKIEVIAPAMDANE